MRKLICISFAIAALASAHAADLSAPLSADAVAALGGRQIRLCMIGDSISWWGEGDFWRQYLLMSMPTLAFVGTHSASLGYAHAGEGGDSTHKVLKRVDDPARIPDCPYYHLLIGINDSAAAKSEEAVGRVASNTVVSIGKIVDRLLARPATRKVFLASILPGGFKGQNPFRDAAGSAANAILRAQFEARFPKGRVVWVEYEKPLRAKLDEWKGEDVLKDGLHPSRKGYKMLSDILAPILMNETAPDSVSRSGVWGVSVENLWDDEAKQTRPLIPGFYILSFVPRGVSGGTMKIRLYTETDDPKLVFDRTYVAKVAHGARCEVSFRTRDSLKQIRIEVPDGSAEEIQIERLRPSCRASRYGKGVFVDAESPICAGELLSAR